VISLLGLDFVAVSLAIFTSLILKAAVFRPRAISIRRCAKPNASCRSSTC